LYKGDPERGSSALRMDGRPSGSNPQERKVAI